MDMNALRAKAQKMKAEKKEEFIPIDLNEGNVQAIFNRCIATKDSKELIRTNSIFKKESVILKILNQLCLIKHKF